MLYLIPSFMPSAHASTTDTLSLRYAGLVVRQLEYKRMPTSAYGKKRNLTPCTRRLGMFDVAKTEIASTCLLMSVVSSTVACNDTRSTLVGSTPESVRK